MSLKMILNLNAEDSLPRLREALAARGCHDGDIRFVWEQIKLNQVGQLNPMTGAKPSRNYFDLQRALNADPAPPSDELAVVWEYADRFTPGNVTISIFGGG